MELGDKIKKARLENSLTLQELGDKVGLSQATLSKYETGDIKNIPNSRLKKISEVLKVDISYFFESKKSKSTILIEKLINLTENEKIKWISPTNPNIDIPFDLVELCEILFDLTSADSKIYSEQANKLDKQKPLISDIYDSIYYVDISNNYYCIYSDGLELNLKVFKLLSDCNLNKIHSIDEVYDIVPTSNDNISKLRDLYDLVSGNESTNKSSFLNDLLDDLDDLDNKPYINPDDIPF
ncbi:Transcriptional regulator, contains XRE-family HTH domain [Peptoniphilus asaccharolyticus DSM 20463]|uniref:Transcriptional regulator, contains XRE-family HTH domain n=1 Tax=Peptoniphilus asaccharolyticus DSM 20463 TaxID=573058 RepID=A0A1W1V9L3_PEPAS|nr:helix-turn-helix transcriptional regulator [Peptoniphilus asaccharolyticus]MBL7575763.1 helix-turn-helix domain-containing protein [Peptoniphilus asaccharolyticus]SMB90089.1 Transcriptional regulator, contains XRE-family HTH domain [Peptoniphilus asaccharolyticus DSM 20463]